MEPASCLTRRDLLKILAAGSLGLSLRPNSALAALRGENAAPRFRIGACDWSIGQRQNIAAFDVAKEIGHLLGHGKVDFRKLKGILEEIGYGGWLVIEGAVGEGQSMKESYIHNQRYLREVFGG